MESKLITVPFDIEKAKAIQNGELEGKIVTRDGRYLKDLQPVPIRLQATVLR